jgi:hypothetical protein
MRRADFCLAESDLLPIADESLHRSETTRWANFGLRRRSKTGAPFDHFVGVGERCPELNRLNSFNLKRRPKCAV